MKKVFLLTMTLVALLTGQAFCSETVISAQTAAATAIVEVKSGEVATIELIGPIGAEEITVERHVSGTHDASGTWETMELEGSAVTGLTTTNHAITFYGPLYFRINKPDTGANSVGVIVRR